MATLGSATKVSLNRLVHHFAFVRHDRELCVRQWSFSTLCFYPQMDVPMVGRFLPECIISLIPWIIFKTQVFLLTCVCNAIIIDVCLLSLTCVCYHWPVFVIIVPLCVSALRFCPGKLFQVPVFVIMLASHFTSICILNISYFKTQSLKMYSNSKIIKLRQRCDCVHLTIVF